MGRLSRPADRARIMADVLAQHAADQAESASLAVSDVRRRVSVMRTDVDTLTAQFRWIIGLLIANLSGVLGLIAWDQRSILAQGERAAERASIAAEATVLRADRRLDEKLRIIAAEVLAQDRAARAQADAMAPMRKTP